MASLVGDPNNIISALEISDFIYEVAWNILKQRYDNKRVIIQNHIKTFQVNFQFAYFDKGKRCRVGVDSGCFRHVQALHVLKRPTLHWDDLLIQILSSKLDALSLREWESSLSSSELFIMKQFMDFITHCCHIREATCKPIMHNQSNPYTRYHSNSKISSTYVATVK